MQVAVLCSYIFKAWYYIIHFAGGRLLVLDVARGPPSKCGRTGARRRLRARNCLGPTGTHKWRQSWECRLASSGHFRRVFPDRQPQNVACFSCLAPCALQRCVCPPGDERCCFLPCIPFRPTAAPDQPRRVCTRCRTPPGISRQVHKGLCVGCSAYPPTRVPSIGSAGPWDKGAVSGDRWRLVLIRWGDHHGHTHPGDGQARGGG